MPCCMCWPSSRTRPAVLCRAPQLQMALEHLLGKHGVDVALSGHHHRWAPRCVAGAYWPGVAWQGTRGKLTENRRRRYMCSCWIAGCI